MQKTILIIVFAFLLDAILGDPQNPFHPIRLIGNIIYRFINLHKKIKNKNHLYSFILGAILSSLLLVFVFFATKIILKLSYFINIYFGFIVEIILCYFLIAPKALKDESMKIYHSLEKNNLEEARLNLSYIVGRDTKKLDFKQIIIATIETVAENLSDGVIAPILFVFIGGIPLGITYKAINTLDSMIAYRNKEFEHFGKFAAKLDDLVNFIPSRVAAIFSIVASKILKLDYKSAIEIYKKDRYKHKSPNSAQTESVFAGALGIQIGGSNYYKDVLVEKPIIGKSIVTPNLNHIILTNKIMYLSTILLIIFLIIISPYIKIR